MTICFTVSTTNFPQCTVLKLQLTKKKQTLAHTVSLGGASYLDVMLYFTPSVYFDISRTANDLLLNMVIAKTQYHPPGLLAIATKGRKSLDV